MKEIGYLKPMRFTQDATQGINLIRAYAPGEVRINDQHLRDAVIVGAEGLTLEPSLRDLPDLSALGEALQNRILAFEPQIILLGTGVKQRFPPMGFGAHFLSRGIGFEVMDTGAACRTFNVLVGEQRRVVAVLIL